MRTLTDNTGKLELMEINAIFFHINLTVKKDNLSYSLSLWIQGTDYIYYSLLDFT